MQTSMTCNLQVSDSSGHARVCVCVCVCVARSTDKQVMQQLHGNRQIRYTWEDRVEAVDSTWHVRCVCVRVCVCVCVSVGVGEIGRAHV